MVLHLVWSHGGAGAVSHRVPLISDLYDSPASRSFEIFIEESVHESPLLAKIYPISDDFNAIYSSLLV